MAIREHVPKLGASQRWVRECDAVLTPSVSAKEESRVWRVLDAILRTTQLELISTHNDLSGRQAPGSRVLWYDPFTKHELPGVPGAFIVKDVFEHSEGGSLMKTVGKVGLLPDEPVAGSATQLSSVLAHNFIWLADVDPISTLYARVVDLLPRTIHGGAVRGINKRFRLYRYRPGALYRPHIDDAWPASALDHTTTPPFYVYDLDSAIYSRLTLLIYLNDDFEGSSTTFFLPSSSPGVLEVRFVKSWTGTVCISPHGAAEMREAEFKMGQNMLFEWRFCMKFTQVKEWKHRKSAKAS